ncbi:MAG: dihydropteroate synthase [Methanosarcina thermophila]|jgi:dihydropteroate synthase|uniref:dihydropteroate synthase n=3 Tax=Methanosarcina thermophila TaxID=2210 RepID=A0A1I6XT97_METTE|nr:dihydropteroate synthase [Methanosarcina thermophila]ALK05704.1 MAG: dihydropteroate synthase [Methanosarcina sp. 795]AKB12842.1 dihydropteroate synthase [Methanosarcina thermophila TM-1]AKB16537.1 dihydropteroate synthase [Methanosarcina thermophila CHTI-55]NLU56865.1 dihydropteroate synthase [Methanosarcina thermophila]SFT41618.1 Dihydropteroate synthase [Methanosarcina thermophila]
MVVDTDICGMKVGDQYPSHVMGIINLSPESFYENSVVNPDSALEIAQKMVKDGATFIDIGARSTWRFSEPISRKEELKRLLPVLETLEGNVDAVISVDTMFSEIAEEALKKGAQVINDVSGFTADPRMVKVVADYGCPAIVMASNKVPGDPLGMDSIIESLDSIIQTAETGGIDPKNLILDPAIGRWTEEKLTIYDLETLDNFDRLKIFEKPLLAALSRKSFIGDVLGKPATERFYGSLAAAAIAVYKGAHIIRTHDVPETFDVVKLSRAVRSRPSVVKEGRYEASVVEVKVPQDAAIVMRRLGVTRTGSQIMQDKSVHLVLKIRNLTTTEALIIKQEMLARGGDAALARDAVSHETEMTDVLVMGTLLQLGRLAKKLEGQVRSLPLIAEMIRECIANRSDLEYRYLR